MNWEIFDRVIAIYAAQHFPGGSFADWAALTLLDERRAARAAAEEAAAQGRRVAELCDEVRPCCGS